ncbi:MAG: hypothetical protein U1G05_10695 [Kiritimatiellia bacterium]
MIPYCELIAPVRWRSYWEYGTNGPGDRGCHLLDVVFFAYDELVSPVSVKTDCPEPATAEFHVNPCKSTLTYAASDRFAGKTFPVHYYDTSQMPTPEQMRIPATALLREGHADGGRMAWRTRSWE